MTKPTMPMPDTTVYGPDRFCAPKHVYFHKNVLAFNKAWAAYHEAELGRVKAEREHAIDEVECLWMAITSHCSSETIKAIEAELVTK